jgi:hypothetical protein
MKVIDMKYDTSIPSHVIKEVGILKGIRDIQKPTFYLVERDSSNEKHSLIMEIS